MESSYYYYYCYSKAQALLELFSGVLYFVVDPFVFLFGWLGWVLVLLLLLLLLLLSEFCGDAVFGLFFVFWFFLGGRVVIFCFSYRIYISTQVTVSVSTNYPFVDHTCAMLYLSP